MAGKDAGHCGGGRQKGRSSMLENRIVRLSSDEICDLRDTLCKVAQLLDGWHQDGTAWSEWDESVRKDVSRLLLKTDKMLRKIFKKEEV